MNNAQTHLKMGYVWTICLVAACGGLLFVRPLPGICVSVSVDIKKAAYAAFFASGD